jgi:phosphate transport system protein
METGATQDELTSLRELRRGYHDRIARLREETLLLLEQAAAAVTRLTGILLDQDREAGEQLADELAGLIPSVASVDAEVLGLLALQAPVARDLRIILAGRDVAHTTALCLGLCQTLARRVICAEGVLSDELRRLIGATGRGAGGLLARAHGAWATLDEMQAYEVIEDAEKSRFVQRDLFAALLDLRDVPVETGLNLGLASRAFGRLTDHAEEIAERVVFAATGASPTFHRTGP